MRLFGTAAAAAFLPAAYDRIYAGSVSCSDVLDKLRVYEKTFLPQARRTDKGMDGKAACERALNGLAAGPIPGEMPESEGPSPWACRRKRTFSIQPNLPL